MRALLSGLLVFLVFLVVHLIVWRIRRPTGQYVGLLILSGIVLFGSLATFSWLAIRGEPPWFFPRDPMEYFSYVLLYVTLSLAYVPTYSCVQADSPSFSILLMIDEVGAKGVSRGELETRFTDEVLVIPRLNDLLSGGLARQVGKRYVITSNGVRMAQVQLYYRGLMRLEKGG